MTGRRKAREAKSRSNCSTAERLGGSDGKRRSQPVRSGLLHRLDRCGAKQAAHARRRPGLQDWTFDLDPLDRHAPARKLLGADIVIDLPLFVVVGVVGTQIEQVIAGEVRGHLNFTVLVRRQVKVAEQPFGLEVGRIQFQPDRPAGGLISGSGDPDAVASRLTAAPKTVQHRR